MLSICAWRLHSSLTPSTRRKTKQRECWKEGVLAVVFCSLIREYTVNLPTSLFFSLVSSGLLAGHPRRDLREVNSWRTVLESLVIGPPAVYNFPAITHGPAKRKSFVTAGKTWPRLKRKHSGQGPSDNTIFLSS